MASITRYKGGWRVQIDRRGVRKSKVFASKQAAKDWAALEEHKIINAKTIASQQPFADVLDRYAREVSPAKRGHRWEVIRLERMKIDKIGGLAIGSITATDMADWRDRRLREVSPGSVRREWGLLGAVFKVARNEWRLITESPLATVSKPPEPRPRDRLPTEDELERLAHAAGDDLSIATARAFHAFKFAGATAMRAGEIVGLTWDRIDLGRRVVTLPMTKNGTERQVPLSSEAVKLLEALPRLDQVFGLTSAQLDALWRKVRDRAAVHGLTFHDSRAWATGKLAKRVDVLTLAKITGHKDLNMLIRVYYREGAEDIAKRLG